MLESADYHPVHGISVFFLQFTILLWMYMHCLSLFLSLSHTCYVFVADTENHLVPLLLLHPSRLLFLGGMCKLALYSSKLSNPFFPAVRLLLRNI